MRKANVRAGAPAGRMTGWLAAVLLMAATAFLGPKLGAMARPLYLFGSLLIGWYAWSRSPGEHLQAVLALFAFTPLLRRLVDFSAGFDPSGAMIAAPLFALLPPVLQLRALTLPGGVTDSRLVPFLLFGVCALYATFLTIAQAEWAGAINSGLKWLAPVAFAAALYCRAAAPANAVQSLASAFAVILPIVGIYGIYQYIDPQPWDQYWLEQASIDSVGQPRPYEVRVFSSMHAPAAFATFTSVGLLLVCILRPRWQILFMLPAMWALSLSLYRTAWIALGASLLFCLFFPVTRGRASAALTLLSAAIISSFLFNLFGDVISDRLSTFGEGADDGSAQARLTELDGMWSRGASSVFGSGFTSNFILGAGVPRNDGMVAECWDSMGVVAGLVCLSSLVYVILYAISTGAGAGKPEGIILGALALGWFVHMPLASIAVGELGFLFWTSTALAISLPPAPAKL